MSTNDFEKKLLLETHYPSERSAPEDGVFEIALVLAGAVSAGCYTAGVMDYLTEALDEWHRLKAEDDRLGRTGTAQQAVPHHKVLLKVIAGASAGGMNGAIAASAYGFLFPHVRGNGRAIGNADDRNNPFYRAWVKDIDFDSLLGMTDIVNDRVPKSILNCRRLKQISDNIVDFNSGVPATGAVRSWLADPFELRLTNTNLRGVPWAFELQVGASKHHGDPHQAFLMHSDQMAFSISRSDEGRRLHRPDCVRLDYRDARTTDAWASLGTAALATGAFPFALEARDISVDRTVYDWRFSFFDKLASGDNRYVFIEPNWPESESEPQFKYTAVDGGVLDNEPFKVAHSVIAGPRGRNDQNGQSANRAVIVIDPFVEDPSLGPLRHDTLDRVATGMLRAQVNQARFSAQDLIQIAREDVYSRFMIAPKRSEDGKTLAVGTQALASGTLGAFGGFIAEEFRHHDYLLGRRNAQWFLRSVFTLPRSNKLFTGRVPPNEQDFADENPPHGEPHLQIIPVCEQSKVEEKLPRWPGGDYSAHTDRIGDAIAVRGKAFADRAIEDIARRFGGKELDARRPFAKAAASTGLARVWLTVGWRASRGTVFSEIAKAFERAIHSIKSRR